MRDRSAVREVQWWNDVKVGDKLREFLHDGDALLHVVAVFDDNGHHYVVTKQWWSGKQRWHYQVHRDTEAMVGLVYRDGDERPK